MALNREDKADVKNAMGKALANKVAKVTRDGSRYAKYSGDPAGDASGGRWMIRGSTPAERAMGGSGRKTLNNKVSKATRDTVPKGEEHLLPGNRSTSAYEGRNHVNRQFKIY